MPTSTISNNVKWTDKPAQGHYPRRLIVTARQKLAMSMRDQGKTFREIGEVMRVTPWAAQQFVVRGRRARERWNSANPMPRKYPKQ